MVKDGGKKIKMAAGRCRRQDGRRVNVLVRVKMADGKQDGRQESRWPPGQVMWLSGIKMAAGFGGVLLVVKMAVGNQDGCQGRSGGV